MFAAIKNNIIQAVSDKNFQLNGCETIEDFSLTPNSVGKIYSKNDEFKVAWVSPHRIACGISTYSFNYIQNLRKLGIELKIFAEYAEKIIGQDEDYVVRCWTRNQKIERLINEINKYSPSHVVINLEWGYWSNLTVFLNLVSRLKQYKITAILHSYFHEHYDKLLALAALENIVVHTVFIKEKMLENKLSSKIEVIEHGCYETINFDKKNWNMFGSEHIVLNFGFLFPYKNTIEAIETIKIVKKRFPDVFYLHLSSTNSKWTNIHNEYRNRVLDKINELELNGNVAIIDGYQDEFIIEQFLRTVRGVCLYPYKGDINGHCWGASGSIRFAMPYLPCVASDSSICKQFLELPIPKGSSPQEWAGLIIHLFEDENYKNDTLIKQREYIKKNSFLNQSGKLVHFLKSEN